MQRKRSDALGGGGIAHAPPWAFRDLRVCFAIPSVWAVDDDRLFLLALRQWSTRSAVWRKLRFEKRVRSGRSVGDAVQAQRTQLNRRKQWEGHLNPGVRRLHPAPTPPTPLYGDPHPQHTATHTPTPT